MRGGKGEFTNTEHEDSPLSTETETKTKTSMTADHETAAASLSAGLTEGSEDNQKSPDDQENNAQLSILEALEKVSVEPEAGNDLIEESGNSYCPECFLPLHPDPKPENLYIFLHALKYTTSLGEFETEMPEWAAKDWEWDQS
jgi:tRNA pseudouridine32 synthase